MHVIMWYPPRMSPVEPISFYDLYESFHSPICNINCGDRCAPYNEKGVPFCCDTHHAVPTAYQPEWEYLFSNTDLWHLWKPNNPELYRQLKKETSPDQVLIECLGHKLCQRDFRSITCRAFPFFPYINENKEFLGLTFYWDYVDRCWIISNLQFVSDQYRSEFVTAFETLFELIPEELASFEHQSRITRRIYKHRSRSIPLFHRNGCNYKISPATERLRRTQLDNLTKFGPYKFASDLPFPDEDSAD